MTENELIQLYEYTLGIFDPETDGIDVIDGGDWVQNGKYQTSKMIVQHKDTGDYWCINHTRAGSYHTDWDTISLSAYKVRKVETTKVIVSWKKITN